MKNITYTDKDTIDELLRLNEELENYFQSTIIPQFFFDKNLILIKHSPAAIKQFNLSNESIGKHLKDLSSNLHYYTLEEDIKKTISTNQALEKEIQTSDEKWYRMNVLPYIERNKKTINGVIITFEDINNYVLSLKELQKLNAEHETFIYSVSHDLKAPLLNIEGLIKAFKESINAADEKERDQIYNMLQLSVSRMKDMISELTKISRLRSGDVSNRTKIQFKDLVNEVQLTLKDKIDESNAKIDYSFDVSEINFSRKDLRSIFYNLLSNAIKYRSNERYPVISITTRREGDYILISVKDNGRGIEENKRGVIFTQFTRVLDNVEGTGIGLFLVSRIVDIQGGKIVVKSKENEGSEFLIYLKA